MTHLKVLTLFPQDTVEITIKNADLSIEESIDFLNEFTQFYNDYMSEHIK